MCSTYLFMILIIYVFIYSSSFDANSLVWILSYCTVVSYCCIDGILLLNFILLDNFIVSWGEWVVSLVSVWNPLKQIPIDNVNMASIESPKTVFFKKQKQNKTKLLAWLYTKRSVHLVPNWEHFILPVQHSNKTLTAIVFIWMSTCNIPVNIPARVRHSVSVFHIDTVKARYNHVATSGLMVKQCHFQQVKTGTNNREDYSVTDSLNL